MFKLLPFWRKETPFIDQKCTYEKVTNNLGRALLPLIWTKSKRTATFFRETIPKILIGCLVHDMNMNMNAQSRFAVDLNERY